MFCREHNRWTPLSKCEFCERERKELEWEIAKAEMENSRPIVLWPLEDEYDWI